MSRINESITSAFACHQAGDLDSAEALYHEALQAEPDNLNGLQLLGALMHQRERPVEAVTLLAQAIAVLERRGEQAAQHAALFNNMGNALRTLGRNAEAAAHYRRGLALDPMLAELHANLGSVLLAEGDHGSAVASYEAALALTPQNAGALLKLAGALVDGGTPEEALAVCARLIEAEPQDAQAHYVLGRAMMGVGDNPGAIEALRHCLELDPRHQGALYNLGALLGRVGFADLAVPLLEMAIEVQPDDGKSFAELGNVLQGRGDAARAHACFRRAVELRPLTSWSAANRPAEFAVLLIQAPGVANTPPEFLFGNASSDQHCFGLMADMTPDIDLLRRHGDIVVNLISDVDQGADVLALAAQVIDRIGKPVINHPRRILRTGREAVAQQLAAIKGSRVPRTMRATRAALMAQGAAARLETDGFAFPLLLRVAGTHGGDAFEKIERADDVARFLATYPDAENLYVIAYVDYRSADGLFRKYRFIFTNGEILPYHLAISRNWKVHYFSTEMDRHAWMQEEEAAFLEDPGRVFTPSQYQCLAAIRAAIGLEFFGIDCSLDRDGNIVVFEVNASMLIHDDNAAFPYRSPSCIRIRQAFQSTLARVAKRDE